MTWTQKPQGSVDKRLASINFFLPVQTLELNNVDSCDPLCNHYYCKVSKFIKVKLSGFLSGFLALVYLCLTIIIFLTDTKQYPAFVGHKPGRNNTQRHKLDIQLIQIMNRTLYIAARYVPPLLPDEWVYCYRPKIQQRLAH